MPGQDPSHWLHRLTAEEWLSAAATELVHCRETLSRRAIRPGATHARRAAGMAMNAILVLSGNDTYGRSYMDHVRALAGDDTVPPDVCASAQNLRDTPPAPPELVKLGKPDLRILEDAERIIAYARMRVAALTASSS
jgi:HEPN domain-containing protein